MKLHYIVLSTYVSVTLCQSTVTQESYSRWPIYGNTTNNTCGNSLFSPANATGVQNPSRYAPNNGLGQWKIAVSTKFSATTIQNNPMLNRTSPGAVANIWLDTFKSIDLTNGNNVYSACAFVFKGLPYNTMLRGQSDDTSCRQTFSKECVDAIQQRAAETAKWFVENPTPGPFSNLTPPILNYICGRIIPGLGFGPTSGPNASTNPFPEQCAPYFENSVPSYPGALDTLSNNITGPQNCTFDTRTNSNHVGGVTSYNVPPGLSYPFNSTNNTATSSYDQLTQQVWPILTVTFTAANNSRSGYVSAGAYMTCLRAGTINDGSRIPATLPAPAPVTFPSHQLSSGAIAGLVIGCVSGVAILVGVIWWVRKVRRRRLAVKSNEKNDLSSATSTMQIDQESVYQLDDKRAPELLDGLPRSEVGHADVRPELSAGSSIPPQELPGSSPAGIVPSKP